MGFPERYAKRMATLPICEFEECFLLLRIDRNWKLCPGDWDFVIATFKDANESPGQNAIINVRLHTGLSGTIIREYPILEWNDHESRVHFVLFPFLVQVQGKDLQISSKFCEARWVEWENILEHDRNEYLKTVLTHITSCVVPCPPGD